jgi:hypothetical protein
MWEVFTTKPWFDTRELVYMGEVPTPWPAFVFTTKRSQQKAGCEEGKAAGEDGSEGLLCVEKERWIKERLFPALCEGARIFVEEATDAGDGQGLSAELYFLREVPALCDRILRVLSSSAQHRTHHEGIRAYGDRRPPVDVTMPVRLSRSTAPGPFERCLDDCDRTYVRTPGTTLLLPWRYRRSN